MRGVAVADRYFFEENGISPVEKRNPEEKAKVYARYQELVLAEAGFKAAKELLLKIMARVQELFKGVRFVLFEDVLPTMKTLKERHLTLGLLTNATQALVSVYRSLGLEPYLDFVVTSEEAGGDKPQPPIFLLALERAGVKPPEAVHVGDQYKIDIVGARGVGIKPILLDRDNLYSEVDCPRIRTLPEIMAYI